jgi:hypothetical protein
MRLAAQRGFGVQGVRASLHGALCRMIGGRRGDLGCEARARPRMENSGCKACHARTIGGRGRPSDDRRGAGGIWGARRPGVIVRASLYGAPCRMIGGRPFYISPKACASQAIIASRVIVANGASLWAGMSGNPNSLVGDGD